MEQPWVPTHVQVTVLRGRGLRGKGKHGTSDVYVVIQLAKEKYSTCVAEKTTEPEWREECCFELQPGVMEMDTGPELVLTVMHRAVIGLDVFLGQAVIQLRKLFHESRGVKNHWYRLNSKTGKKEKERGDIQVSVQFTRNNLTASMYDLVMKDKGGASTFSKLKERMRGKRRSSEDDSTLAPPGTTVPGGTGPLCRVRQRLPSDGGGEEDYEDDEGGEVRRSKMRTFFLRGKLRKSSDTRSSTSLGSESSESSRGGSLSPTAGISVVVSDLSNSPSNSSNLTADSPEHIADTSPKLSPLRCDFSDDFNEITIAVPQLPVGVNETHKPQPRRDQASAAPEASLGLGHLQKTLPLSVSLQNLRPRPSAEPLHGTVGDGRRWSFDKAGEEESAAIAAAMEKNCPVLGREDQCEEAEEHSGTDAKHKGWFGSKESHSKPSPHPVRPLGRGTLSEGRSVLDKIKSSIHPGRSSQTSEKILTEGAGSYYHLTHSELIGLLVRREAELERQKAEFQQQRALLAKREVELRKLKPQVRDLEDYIDTLLVRIMEQKPTLLQVRSRLK
ncbi:rab11 family-interacting protein 5 isoform X4 [Vanacampus margaritifer]